MAELGTRSASLQRFGEHAGHIYAVAWNSTGSLVASGGADKQVKIYSFAEATSTPGGNTIPTHRLGQVGSIGAHKGTVECIAWDPSDPAKVCSVSTGLVHIADVTKLKKKTGSLSHKVTTGLYCCAYAPAGGGLAVSGRETQTDDSVMVFVVEPRRLTPVMKKPKRFPNRQINTIKWAPDGAHILVASTGVVDVLSAADLSVVHSFRAHGSNIYAIDFSPDGSALALGSADSLVSVWSADDLSCLGSLSSDPTTVRSVSWDAGGRYLAWACERNKVDIGEAGQQRGFFCVDTDATVNAVAWHPTQHILAAACDRAAQTHTLSFGGMNGAGNGGIASVHLFSFR
uniref:Anaphase-promoting complex subunit 4 WD40 domain-containing protein n=1 Tax=Phaeomonas parva TaxID=124430 RepID=A0A7S1XPK7_9STRA|mmetsp:Transcript_22156/g.68046  ORF Transcript_22156/g.68046 Transcript_22156/m.68046 type:complete len:343 (+) Transcript_22156:142-1170(+)